MEFTTMLGHSLIKSVSLSVGPSKGWFCDKCNYRKSDYEPQKDSICGQELKKFSYDKLRDAYYDVYNMELTDDELQNLDPHVDDTLDSDYDLYDHTTCDSKEFHYVANPAGTVIDHCDVDSEWYRIWEELTR